MGIVAGSNELDLERSLPHGSQQTLSCVHVRRPREQSGLASAAEPPKPASQRARGKGIPEKGWKSRSLWITFPPHISTRMERPFLLPEIMRAQRSLRPCAPLKFSLTLGLQRRAGRSPQHPPSHWFPDAREQISRLRSPLQASPLPRHRVRGQKSGPRGAESSPRASPH